MAQNDSLVDKGYLRFTSLMKYQMCLESAEGKREGVWKRERGLGKSTKPVPTSLADVIRGEMVRVGVMTQLVVGWKEMRGDLTCQNV